MNNELFNEQVKKLRHLDMDDLIFLSHLSFGGRPSSAAALLGLTPPAISHRIKKIEEVFGIRLFNRRGTHLTLNDDGRDLSTKANKALRALQ